MWATQIAFVTSSLARVFSNSKFLVILGIASHSSVAIVRRSVAVARRFFAFSTSPCAAFWAFCTIFFLLFTPVRLFCAFSSAVVAWLRYSWELLRTSPSALISSSISWAFPHASSATSMASSTSRAWKPRFALTLKKKMSVAQAS